MSEQDRRALAELQIARFHELKALGHTDLGGLFARATSPDDVRRALLRDVPLLEAREAMRSVGPDLTATRAEAARAGQLGASPDDLAFRRLYPSLDVGIYAASHAMGKPSLALAPALREHANLLAIHGIGVWRDGGWLDVIDAFRERVAELCGGDLDTGDVLAFRNFSDGLSSLLNGGIVGRMVTTAGHFTTAHYVHAWWAERTGSEVVTVPAEPDGTVSLDKLLDAITQDTTVISLSHALWRNGFLHDLDAITEVVMARCPSAAFLLDGYQTLGTVPVDTSALPTFSAVLGGGGKQLRAGTGSGFAWVAGPLLELLEPDRIGWWAHRDPISFAPALTWADGANRFHTGVPDITPLVALVTELDVLASSAAGSLTDAVVRARRLTSDVTTSALEMAVSLGLSPASPRDAARRAGFIALRLDGGQAVVDQLATDGITVDFRPDAPGATAGNLRLSANSASFAYELLYVVERIAALAR